ncbi:MAG: hypothetical protein R3E89_08020 [Thiolinea sp.]
MGWEIFFLLSIAILLFKINFEININNLYFSGGSDIDCGMGVNGSFKPKFLSILAMTDLILIISSILLFSTSKILYLYLASVANISLLLLDTIWRQPRLFIGYELTAETNMLDALTGKCFLFYGPHNGTLLLAILFYITIIAMSQQVVRRRTR